ncbi:MAG: hypothetical protein V4599_08860 [Verrucomicrobiota bacterium]
MSSNNSIDGYNYADSECGLRLGRVPALAMTMMVVAQKIQDHQEK